jgi:exodeoxyribonuclease VII large subunit
VSGYWPLGESARQQELAQLRAELDDEGLFDPERKRPIPDYPRRIGLVTSLSGSAREDVWTTVTKRSPRTDVLLCGATVQGEDAVPSLLDAINRLDQDPEIETLVVTRGGGSDVDLWSFNAEPLVRRIANCTTSVVVAVGHEDDDTLAEAAADRRAKTPTEAGVIATSQFQELRTELGSLEGRIARAHDSLVTSRLDGLERRIEASHRNIIQQADQRKAVRKLRIAVLVLLILVGLTLATLLFVLFV